MARADYGGFETTYRRLREAGTDWNTSGQLAETLTHLARHLERPGVPRAGRLLELGCGAGDISAWAARRGFEVYGVDVSPTAIAWARDNFAKQGLAGDFRAASVLDLREFADDFFDVVLDGHCFHCIIGDDRPVFLANARRVLKPGGTFHVATMCGELQDPRTRAAFDRATRCLMRDGVAIRQINEATDIVREVEAAGFRVLEWEIDPARGIDDQDDLLLNATK